MPKTVEPSPSTATTGRSGQAHAQADGGGQAPAETAHRRADHAERPAGRQAQHQLVAVRRALLDDDRVRRQPVAERLQHVAGSERRDRPAAGPAAGRAAAPGRARCGDPRCELGADEVGRGEDGELRGAAVHLVGIVADDGEHGPLAHERARARTSSAGTPARRRRARGRTARASRAAAGAGTASGPAHCGWSCGNPAWPLNGSW